MMKEFKLVKIDFDALYEEAEAMGREGECPECGEVHMLCWCGLCLKYCHDDYEHSWAFDPMEPGP